MDIHHLRIFSSVYKNMSFTKASEELNITQPTISEHIKNLEAKLGCRLFDRLGRSIMATREADALYPRAVKVIDDLNRLHEDIAAVSEDVKGEIVIGASTIPGTYILPAMAMEFKKNNPNISFEIKIEDSGKITNLVQNHDLFCGIVGAKMDARKLTYRPFVEDELVLVGKNKKKNKAISSAELYDLPFLVREQGSGTRKCMNDFFTEAGIDINRLNVVATLGSSASIKEAIKAGLGVSIISKIAAQDELNKGLLTEITIKGMEMKRSFYLVCYKGRTLPRHYQAFCNYLKKAGI